MTGEQPAPAGVMVESRIIRANGEPITVDYMLHRSGGGWLISDIYLDGTISDIFSRRRRLRVALDGESRFFDTPLHYRIRPRALRVIIPEPGSS